MHEAARIITQEHRRVAAVLSCLKQLISEAAEHPDSANFAAYGSALSYLEEFLFRFHHPKEDQYLFPALRERCESAASLIDDLSRQHERGDELLDGVRIALDMYRRQRDDTGRASFEQALGAYHEFEYAHMTQEERELLPLASEFLNADDWAEVAAVFRSNDDPLFGRDRREEFQELFRLVANSVPAPHGLGPSAPA